MKAIIFICLVALAFAATNTANATEKAKAIEAQLTPSAKVQVQIASAKKRETELTKEVAEDLVALKKAQAKLKASQEHLKKVKAAPTKVHKPVEVKTVPTVAQTQEIKPAAPVNVTMTEQEKKLFAQINSIEQEEAKLRRELRNLKRKNWEAKRAKEREEALKKHTTELAKAEAEVKLVAEDVKHSQAELDKDLKELANVQSNIKKLEKELKKLNLEAKLQAEKTRKGQLVQEIVNDVTAIAKEQEKLAKAKEHLDKVNVTKVANNRPANRPHREIKPHRPVEKIFVPNPFETEEEKKINAAIHALELNELKLEKQLRDIKRQEHWKKRQLEREAELKKFTNEIEKAAAEVKHATEDVADAQKELDKDIEELTSVQNKIHATESEIKKLSK